MSTLKGRHKFFYGITEDNYVPPEAEKQKRRRRTSIDSFKFRIPELLRGRPKIPLKEVPLRFHTSPDTLVELASEVVNKEPLPTPFQLNNLRIRHWIKDLGFPHYMVSAYTALYTNILYTTYKS